MTNNLCADNRQPLVSVIIPVLNESGHIEHCLRQFHDRDSRVVEIVVVDGGSADNTVALAAPLADRVLVSGDCRSAQMNAGVRAASGQWLIFLHADTRLPRRFDSLLDCLSTTEYVWGFCRVKLSGRNRMFRVIETAINWRSQITSVATGDQMMFVRKALFDQLHGFPEIPLMEDVAISKKLKRRSSLWSGLTR